MEILVILFLLGLLLAIGKWAYEFFFVTHRRFTLVMIGAAIGVVALGVAISVYKEVQQKEERLAEVERARERVRQREERARREQEERELQVRLAAEEKQKAKSRQKLEREDKIRSFAMRESPDLWSAYQELIGSVDVQAKRVDELRKELIDFNRKPETHPEYQKVCMLFEEMKTTRDTIRVKLEEAYLASRAFDALPEQGKAKAQACIQEAETALDKYKRLVLDIKTEPVKKEAKHE